MFNYLRDATYLLSHSQDFCLANRWSIPSCFHINYSRSQALHFSATRLVDCSCYRRTWSSRWSRSRGYRWSRRTHCRRGLVILLAGKQSRPPTISMWNLSSRGYHKDRDYLFWESTQITLKDFLRTIISRNLISQFSGINHEIKFCKKFQNQLFFPECVTECVKFANFSLWITKLNSAKMHVWVEVRKLLDAMEMREKVPSHWIS